MFKCFDFMYVCMYVCMYVLCTHVRTYVKASVLTDYYFIKLFDYFHEFFVFDIHNFFGTQI